LPISAFRALRTMLFIGCVFIMPSAALFAQEEAPVPEVDAHTLAEEAIVFDWDDAAGTILPTPAISPGSIFRVVLTLAVVAAAIYGFIFLLKKASRGGRASQDPFLKVLATASMGTNRGVYVVSVGSQAWLVGAAEHGVNLISEIADKEVIDAMLLEDSRKSAEFPTGRLPDFKSMLRRFGAPGDPDSPSPENIRKRSERLKGM